jgi:hypothetical protein
MKEFIADSNEAASEFSEVVQTGFEVQSWFKQEVGLESGHDYFLQM